MKNKFSQKKFDKTYNKFYQVKTELETLVKFDKYKQLYTSPEAKVIETQMETVICKSGTPEEPRSTEGINSMNRGYGSDW